MSEPVYERLDFNRDSDAFLGQVTSDGCDWLGLDDRGRFVLGYPQRSGGMTASAALVIGRASLPDPRHKVRFVSVGGSQTEPFATEDEAKRHFATLVTEARQREQLAVVRVQRLLDDRVVEEEIIIQNLTRALEQFLDSQSLTFIGVVAGIALTFGFGFGTTTMWWGGVVAAVLSLFGTLALLRWSASRRVLVRLAAWTLRQAQ